MHSLLARLNHNTSGATVVSSFALSCDCVISSPGLVRLLSEPLLIPPGCQQILMRRLESELFFFQSMRGEEGAVRARGQQGSRVACATFPAGHQEVLTMSVPLKLQPWVCTVCPFQSTDFFLSLPSSTNTNRNEPPPWKCCLCICVLTILLQENVKNSRVLSKFCPTAQGSMDEEPDDYWRRPQVQANLRSGHLLSGDP